MKKLLFTLSLLSVTILSHAQGLEKIIVERYYVSNSADATGSDGTLPAGSVTYRIYVDMLPNYRFKAAYGSSTHTLFMKTSTSFFNNEAYGAGTPNGITANHSKLNSVLLDSWISAGAAAQSQVGVLKTEDTNGSIGNTSSMLQNADVSAGTPVSTEDGMIPGSPSGVTVVGTANGVSFDPTDADFVLGATSQISDSLVIDGTGGGGSWASTAGAPGALASNTVLIAQLTTEGILTFELNISIGLYDSNGQPVFVDGQPVVEYYVARNATGSEMTHHSLTYPDMFTGTNTIASVPIASTFFNVYPNPSSNLLTVDISAAKDDKVRSYALYDLTGKAVLGKNLNKVNNMHKEVIDISSLSQGVYILSLVTDKSTIAKKIIKN